MVLWFLHTLFVSPIKWFMELFLSVLSSSMNAFIAVVFLSIAVNFLLSPVQRSIAGLREGIWRESDAVRERSEHIRRTFSGVERQMILSAYYREQGYSPLSPLLLTIPTLVQIPFFMAAWEAVALSARFVNASFFGLFTFGVPDGLFSVGDFSVNVLPVVMTVINLITAFVVMRGRKLSESIGSFVLPFVFLALLYGAPSGMVLYWTTSQVLSLARSVVLPHLSRLAKRVLSIVVAVLVVVVTCVMSFSGMGVIMASACVTTAVACMALFVWFNWADGVWSMPSAGEIASFGGLSLAFGLLSSVVFPLAFVHGNLADFSASGIDYGPGILVSGVAAIGLYGLLLPLLFVFCLPVSRTRLTRFAFCCCILAPLCSYVICDYRADAIYDFSRILDSGNVNGFIIMASAYLLLSVFGVACYFAKRFSKFYGWFALSFLGVIVTYCVICLPDVFVVTSNADSQWQDHYLFSEDGQPEKFLKLSKTEKNVVVIFLDNATSYVMDSMFSSMPELQDKYDGFVLYPNCLSGGGHTIYGNMPLYAGYDYWFDKFLVDDGVSLADKENVAQLLMPRIFAKEGFTTSEVSPPLSGDFTWGEDFSAFEAEGNVGAYTKSRLYEGLGNDFYGFGVDNYVEQRVFMFGFMRAVPQFAKHIVNDGDYYGNAEDEHVTALPYLNEHIFIDRLSDFTSVDDCAGHFSVVRSMMVHDLCDVNYETGSLAVDENTPSVDDLPFDHGDNFGVAKYYFSNLLCFINRFGVWLDYLRAEGVYDNTRIIIVGDHGALDAKCQKFGDKDFYLDGFNPLMMVKDFDSHGFSVSDEFMTNADTPLLALDGIVENPVDPVTGKPLSDEAKNGSLSVTYSDSFNPDDHEQNRFVIDESELGTFDGCDVYNQDSWHFEGLESGGDE